MSVTDAVPPSPTALSLPPCIRAIKRLVENSEVSANKPVLKDKTRLLVFLERIKWEEQSILTINDYEEPM